MGKFKARFVVIPVLAVAAAGGVFGMIKVNQMKGIVKVTPVQEVIDEAVMYEGELNGDTYYGKLVKGSVLNVKVNSQLTVKSVNVKKGDTVKKGDVLITYDTHSLEDSVEDAQLRVTTLTNNITMIQNELDILTRLQPSENAPQTIVIEQEPDEPETPDLPEEEPVPEPSKYEKTITAKTLPIGGTGTADDPFVFLAGTDTVVSKDALLALANKEAPMAAIFYVCTEDDIQLYARFIDGSKLDPEKAADFPLNDGVTVTPDGMIAFNGGEYDFAAFVTSSAGTQAMPQDEFAFPDDDQIFFPEEIQEEVVTKTPSPEKQAGEVSLDDNYLYSRQELKDMISAKEKEKAGLELQKKQAELDARKAKRLSEMGGEISTIDGKVTFLAKDGFHLSDSGAYITVTNDGGMSVTAMVGEFSLDRVSVGMTADIKNFETGAEATGTVTDIETTPVNESTSGFGETSMDDMESKYRFTVMIDDDMEISEDSEVQIKIVNEADEDIIQLPQPLVRSEAGRYYVMAANEQGLLEKKYVKVGETNVGSIEILDGLELDDKIGFPYGKAVEGAQTTDASFEQMYYNFGLFY